MDMEVFRIGRPRVIVTSPSRPHWRREASPGSSKPGALWRFFGTAYPDLDGPGEVLFRGAHRKRFRNSIICREVSRVYQSIPPEAYTSINILD